MDEPINETYSMSWDVCSDRNSAWYRPKTQYSLHTLYFTFTLTPI